MAIGAIRGTTPMAGATSGAADAALILISAGGKPDGEMVRRLTELKEAADNNQEVYDKASKAVNDLSRKESEVAKLSLETSERVKSAVKKEREDAETFLKRKAEIDLKAAKLKLEREGFDKASDKRRTDQDSRDNALTMREKASELAESQNREASSTVSRREESVSGRESDLQALLADLTALLGRAGAV